MSGEVLYLDSSAIVKMIVWEKESPALVRTIRGARIVSSLISRIEVLRAARRVGTARVLRRAAAVVDSLYLRPVDSRIVDVATRLAPASLRSLDALHLASALSIEEVAAFVTYDAALGVAAASAGLTVASPA